MTLILLIRHGQASFGADDYDRLNETGERQAAVLGDYLSRHDAALPATVSGGLRRQTETARLMLAAAAAVDPRFDEYRADDILASYLPGLVERTPALAAPGGGTSRERRLFQEQLSRCMGLWVEGAEGHGGETWAAFAARVREGLEAHLVGRRRDETVAVVSSAGVIATLVGQTLALRPADILRLNWRIFNASLTTLNYGRSGYSLIGFNETAHLRLADPRLITLR